MTKLPVSPPAGLLLPSRANLERIIAARIGPEIKGRYLPWDKVRHLSPPEGLSNEEWWMGISWARSGLRRDIEPLRTKAAHFPTIAITDSMSAMLHYVDREAGGTLEGAAAKGKGLEGLDRYLIRSLIEESMSSSQLEGADTQPQVAKEMLRSGRQPRDLGEVMIFNNYKVMSKLREWLDKPLTSDAIFQIHRMLTEGTMDDPTAAGRFRRTDEDICVEDRRDGEVVHRPPPAHELPQRLQALCDFANADPDAGGRFLHPVIRAIAIHFQLGYDHPFVDGNGRTARALFYWSMLRSEYWLTEFLSISSVLKHAPVQYAKAFQYTEAEDCDLGYFVVHQLDVIIKALEGLKVYIQRKNDERRKAETLLRPGASIGAQLNHRQRELLINALRDVGRAYTIKVHQGTHKVVYETARTDLMGLVEMGLMTQSQAGRQLYFHAVPDLAKRMEDPR